MDKDKNTNEIDYDLYKHIEDYTNTMCNMELKRQENILSQSGNLMQLFFILIALFGIIGLLAIEKLFSVPKVGLIVEICVVCVPMLTSFILAVIAQWRFKYKTGINPNILLSDAKQAQESRAAKRAILEQIIESINETQETMKKTNNKRSRIITASFICMFVAIGIFCIYTPSLILI
ncbi:MAG: hypothetical protein J6J36_05705 [Clostridia bacterium]|nr:hypothetical protein [Clostridia bacterium]